MKALTGTVLTLLVGCATGAMVRDAMVVPARAQGNAATYEYKAIERDDLVRMGNRLGYESGSDATTRAMNELGKNGWAFTSCLERTCYFQARSGDR
jgi:hypothetical protein